jgi:small-conductance mechanosensitive channel
MELFAMQVIDPSGVDELIDTTNVTGWDFLWAALTIVAGFVIARLARVVTTRALSGVPDMPNNVVNLVVKLAGWAVITVAIVLALPFIGVDTGPVVIVVVLLAGAAVLSGRVLIENLGAGVILQTEATFAPGDQIETNDCVGRVVEVSSRAVKMESIDGRRIIIPNISVLSGSVTNLTTHPERRSELVVGLEYGTDLDAAREVLVAAAQDAAGVLADPPVDVFVATFGESSIDFRVWYWHESDIRSHYEATDSVARSIDRACRRNGLTIAFPQRMLWWGDGPPAEAED